MSFDRDYWANCARCRSASFPGAVYALLESYYVGPPECPHCHTDSPDWAFFEAPETEDESSEARPQGVPAARQD